MQVGQLTAGLIAAHFRIQFTARTGSNFRNGCTATSGMNVLRLGAQEEQELVRFSRTSALSRDVASAVVALEHSAARLEAAQWGKQAR